jgi:tryptophan synthase beta chain
MVDFKPTDIVVLTLSGRGDKDMDTYIGEMTREP